MGICLWNNIIEHCDSYIDDFAGLGTSGLIDGFKSALENNEQQDKKKKFEIQFHIDACEFCVLTALEALTD